MGSLSPMHWLIVIGVLVLLFGAKKLPDMARSVGQSARVFKGEIKGLKDDTATPDASDIPPAAHAQTPAAAPPAGTTARDATALNTAAALNSAAAVPATAVAPDPAHRN